MNRRDMKTIQVVAILVMAAVYALFAISTNIWQMYIASAVIGFVYMSIAILPISVMIRKLV